MQKYLSYQIDIGGGHDSRSQALNKEFHNKFHYSYQAFCLLYILLLRTHYTMGVYILASTLVADTLYFSKYFKILFYYIKLKSRLSVCPPALFGTLIYNSVVSV